MTDEIRVTVASYGAGRNLMMTYRDPITGKKVAKTAGTTDRSKALMEAGKWQDELNSGRYQPPSRLTWAQFRERFEEEKLAPMPRSTQEAYRAALGRFERLVGADRMVKVTARAMSRFQAEARKEGVKETTLHKWLRHLKAALRWGERQGLIHKAPAIEMPKLPRGHLGKHRAITAEEYDRLVQAIPKASRRDPEQFQRLAKGLWLSGLRLSEALALDWNEGPFVLDTTGNRPVFRIQAEGQKSRRSELTPITPDFAEWILAETPTEQRYGRVFPMVTSAGCPMCRQDVGKVIAAAGRKAGIVVGESEKVSKDDAGRLVRTPIKLFATAHDLRRAFCTRWAKRVMPPVLQKLARHANISTTMGYYVTMTAAEVADDLWAKHGSGNTSGNTRPKEAQLDAARD